MSKPCIKCKEVKSLENYQLRKDTGKYRNECKNCSQTRINTYRRENIEYKKRYNEYRKSRRRTDVQFAVMDRLRARIRKMMKSNNSEKCVATIELLGCSLDKFKEHLISKFYGEMCWEKKNFVLDHIVPCSWFDLTNTVHQKICFNFKNIQPLTEKDNSEKSDKIWTKYDLTKNPYI